MHVVCVHVHVKPEHRDAFLAASLANAEGAVHEPGNLRFDVLEQSDVPDRFVLLEVYRDEAAAQAHKQTAHYQHWRDTVADWMAEPRQGVQYTVHFPKEASAWKMK